MCLWLSAPFVIGCSFAPFPFVVFMQIQTQNRIRKNVEAGKADAAARSEAHAVLHAAALSKETVKATGEGGGLLLAKD